MLKHRSTNYSRALSTLTLTGNQLRPNTDRCSTEILFTNWASWIQPSMRPGLLKRHKLRPNRPVRLSLFHQQLTRGRRNKSSLTRKPKLGTWNAWRHSQTRVTFMIRTSTTSLSSHTSQNQVFPFKRRLRKELSTNFNADLSEMKTNFGQRSGINAVMILRQLSN